MYYITRVKSDGPSACLAFSDQAAWWNGRAPLLVMFWN